jgi:hypothetical protein
LPQTFTDETNRIQNSGVRSQNKSRSEGLTLSKIGVRFNRDITTLSRMVNKIEKRVREDKNYGEALLQYYNNAIMQA